MSQKKRKLTSLFKLREISEKRLLVFLSGAVIFTVAFTFIAALLIASRFEQEVRRQNIDSLFGAAIAGPLQFARLQSADIAQEQLAKLMDLSNYRSRGIKRVSIYGGPSKVYKFADWESKDNQSKCVTNEERNFSFSDSLNPYSIKISYDRCERVSESKSIFALAIASICLTLALVSIFLAVALKPIFSSLKNASDILSGSNDGRSNHISFTPVRLLINLAIKSEEFKNKIAVAKISEQFSHDIRSPLAALELALMLDTNEQDRKDLLRNAVSRIRDIANSVLFKDQETHKNTEKSLVVALKSELLVLSIEKLVSEKRLRFPEITFFMVLDCKKFLTADIDKSQFERAVSNVLENSVDALRDIRNPSISIRVYIETDNAIIEVTDNGPGISSGLLPKITARGFTHGKVHGSGLGLSQVEDALLSFGGNLEITSELGKYTRVKLNLPTSQPPSWLCNRIDIHRNAAVIVLDDDSSVLTFWKNVLKNLSFPLGAVLTTSSAHEFRDNINKLRNSSTKNLLLVDYQMDSINIRGIDILDESPSTFEKILVTSHYENEEIRKWCERTSTKLLPKPLLSQIEIYES